MSEDFYNKFFAAGHHRDWKDAPGKLVVLAYIISRTKNNSLLLDIGCGDGYFLNRIVGEGRNQEIALTGVGVDISIEAIRLAKTSYPAQEFSVMDAEHLDFGNEEFDAVVSYGVFEHLSSPAVGVKELSRVLRKGGIFAMLMPTIGHYRKDRYDEGWYEDLNTPPQMQWNYPREKWEQLFVNANLELDAMSLASNYGAINSGNFYFGRKL